MNLIILLDDVIICFELFFVDVRVEFNVFVANPLFRRNGKNVVTADNLEAHPRHVVHAELDVRHACVGVSDY